MWIKVHVGGSLSAARDNAQFALRAGHSRTGMWLNISDETLSKISSLSLRSAAILIVERLACVRSFYFRG